MNLIWTEGKKGSEKWDFHFTGLRMSVEKPDDIERTLKAVDFVVRYQGKTWLIECKNPEGAAPAHRAEQIKDALSKIRNEDLLKEHLLPKLYGTYVHLTMTGKLRKGRVRYEIIIGISTLDAPMRLAMMGKMQRVINQIGPKSSPSSHVPVVEVHNVASWNAAHPEMSITRRP